MLKRGREGLRSKTMKTSSGEGEREGKEKERKGKERVSE